MLAGISADYYLRLERGRDTNPSAQVLEALARVLQLDDVESQYLLNMAVGQTRSRPRRRHPDERVPARLHQLLAAVGMPAFIEGKYFDVLASNAFAVSLSPRLRVGENRLRSLFLDPEEQEFQHDWEASTAGFVAGFRQTVGDFSDDPRLLELIGELSVASARFRTLWARHDVRELSGGTTTVNHPLVGEMQLNRDKLPVGDLVLVLYYADQGTASAEKLRILASLAAVSDAAPAQRD